MSTESNGVITVTAGHEPLALRTEKTLPTKSHHEDAGNWLEDERVFAHLQRVAGLLANGSLTPAHLIVRGNDKATLANCFQIVTQAQRWGMDPFAVAPETYVVQNKLGYGGKLVAALLNTRAGLAGNLRYEFKGTGDNLTVTVIGRIAGEDKDRTVELSVGQAKTRNEMWLKDPQQKLCYSGSVRWARRHCPEVILGVLTDDDLERMGSTRHGVLEITKRGEAELNRQFGFETADASTDVDPETVFEHPEPAGVPTSTVGDLATLAEKLGCPEDECLNVAEAALRGDHAADPEAWIKTKPWPKGTKTQKQLS